MAGKTSLKQSRALAIRKKRTKCPTNLDRREKTGGEPGTDPRSAAAAAAATALPAAAAGGQRPFVTAGYKEI